MRSHRSENDVHFHAKKFIHKKGFALSLVLKVKVFWNSEMAYLAGLSPMDAFSIDGPQPRAKGRKSIAHSPYPKNLEYFLRLLFSVFLPAIPVCFWWLKKSCA